MAKARKERKDAFALLYSIGPEKMELVKSMLTRDTTPAEVARVIQEDWKLLTNMEADSLRKNIDRFRKKKVDPKIAEAAARTMTSEPVRRELAKLAPKLDVVADLEEMCALQKARILKIVRSENALTAGILLGNVKAELDVYTRMMRVLGDFQLETGHMVRVPRRVAGLFHMGGDKNEVFEFEVQIENRNQLLEATQKVFAVLEGVEYQHLGPTTRQ